MTPKELMYVKRVQRSFKELFQRELIVDFPAMNGEKIPKKEDREDELEGYLKVCMKIYKVPIGEVIRKRSRKSMTTPLRNLLQDYSKFIMKNKLNIEKGAALIDRDRSLIYHYAKGGLL
jgi:hypothetical protein